MYKLKKKTMGGEIENSLKIVCINASTNEITFIKIEQCKIYDTEQLQELFPKAQYRGMFTTGLRQIILFDKNLHTIQWNSIIRVKTIYGEFETKCLYFIFTNDSEIWRLYKIWDSKSSTQTISLTQTINDSETIKQKEQKEQKEDEDEFTFF